MARHHLAQDAVSLLRIHGSLTEPPHRCQWSLIEDGLEPVCADGSLEDLPRGARRIQLVIPAAQVLLVRTRVPHGARRQAGSALAFAVEDQTAADPQFNQVSWLGSVGEEDVLAVVDKQGLAKWREALAAAGIRRYEVHCETLLLPWATDEWSLAWNGAEGFVRTGEFEGAATDCGDHATPPLSLQLMLQEVQARSAGPSSIAIHTTSAQSAPDLPAWQAALGIALRPGLASDWRSAPPGAGFSLAQEQLRWQSISGLAGRLRPAAWILGATLALHGVALMADWTSLANEQRTLRRQMESQFRALFPDAVAVVDPALQMRRKLSEARHAAGKSDSGDFLPMIGLVVTAMGDSPAGRAQIVAYESGRLTLELAASTAAMEQLVMRLRQSGLSVEAGAKTPGDATTVITLRTS